MTRADPLAPDLHTEADADVRVVYPFLQSLGFGPDQVRVQRTFSLRLGRGMVHGVEGKGTKGGRLDYLIVTPDGAPLFVVEMKAQHEPLTEDDRDQGISYARLVHPIAPLVLVTNTKDSELYDTVTRERLVSAEGAALIRGGGKLTADEDIRLRAEALEHFIGYSADNLSAFSRLQRLSRMETILGTGELTRKYEPRLYVPRVGVRAAVDAFLASKDIVFALGGPSGAGKTNEMCALAEHLGSTHLTLFFQGAQLFGSFAGTLSEEFGWFFSQPLPLPQVCQRLARLSDRSGKPVLILIDAVDEAIGDTRPHELSDLAARLQQFDGRIRLLISAKPHEWERFVATRGVPSPLRERLFNRSTASSQAPMSIVIEGFTDAERERAVTTYGSAFGIGREWPGGLLELASDPFMLRLIAEIAASTGAMPADVAERELLRRYVEQKLRRTSDPRRSLLELIAVGKALASETTPSEAKERSHRWWLHNATVRDTLSVPEATVRSGAGLPSTAPLADELVAFGVLLRSADGDGRTKLAFSYDRVRDYVVAVHVLELPGLALGAFRDRAVAALQHDVTSDALLWYLRYATPEQWEGFKEAGDIQVSRFLDAYEALRAHLAEPIRRIIGPPGAGAIGAVYTVTPRGTSALALFRRPTPDLPRIRFDTETFDWSRSAVKGPIPQKLLGASMSQHGFWFLHDPERYAANRLLEELTKVIEGGCLVEATDPLLLAERVLTLARAHHKQLKLTRSPKTPHRFADMILGAELVPLDLVDLRRRIQVELLFQHYLFADMNRRAEAKRRELEARGETTQVIAVTDGWTSDEHREWRERAEREVEAGLVRFPTDDSGPDLTGLLVSVEALLTYVTTLESPLPLADRRDPTNFAGEHNFEEGYSDEQLVLLLETILNHGRSAYRSVMNASFGESWRQLMQAPPDRPAAICYRRSLAARPSPQFAADLTFGTVINDDFTGEAFVAVVSDNGTTTIQHTGEHGFTALVKTPSQSVTLRVSRWTDLIAIILPHRAPGFCRGGATSEARHAPVRAQVYAMAAEAISALSAEDLLSGLLPSDRSRSEGA